MSTSFEWLVVRCMDGRLNSAIDQYLKERNVPDHFDHISLPSGPRDLQTADSLLLKSITNVSVGLHDVQKVMLI